MLDPVKSGEGWILLGQLVIVGARIHRAVEVAEQLGDGLDLLVMGPGRREQGLGGGDIAGLDGIGERLGLRDQPLQRLRHVDLVLGDRRHECQRRHVRTGGQRRGTEQGSGQCQGWENATGHCCLAGWCDVESTGRARSIGRLEQRAAEIVARFGHAG